MSESEQLRMHFDELCIELEKTTAYKAIKRSVFWLAIKIESALVYWWNYRLRQ